MPLAFRNDKQGTDKTYATVFVMIDDIVREGEFLFVIN